MGAQTVVWVNDVPLERYGLQVASVEGWASAAAGKFPSSKMYGAAGVIPVSLRRDILPRELVLLGTVVGTPASLPGQVDRLKELCGQGLVELRFVDNPNRVYTGVLIDGLVAPRTSSQFTAHGWSVSLRFECMNPYGYDREATIVGFASSTQPGYCPLGSAPVAPIIYVIGSATNPTVTLRDHVGNILGTTSFTVTLDASDYLIVDCATKLVTLSNNGSQSDGLSLLTGGDFPVLDPLYSDRDGEAWPSLEVSGGTGQAHYRKAWL